jgi:hypothetical protein
MVTPLLLLLFSPIFLMQLKLYAVVAVVADSADAAVVVYPPRLTYVS